MFVCAAAQTLPGLLAGAGDEISVNYPWGSLLKALALPDCELLSKLAAVGKSGARVLATINVQPLRDREQAERLGLASATLLRGEGALREAYARAGIEIVRVRQACSEELPATSWGRHLAVSKREVLRIEARTR